MPNRRFLILDDAPAVGQTIQWIAESLGFEAGFVTRPEDFFRRLIQMGPEFITIDLAMPELDGVEIMRLLAERKCASKIIISSGMGTRVLDAAQTVGFGARPEYCGRRFQTDFQGGSSLARR